MTINELIAEAERLAKPSLLLSPKPNEGPIVAYWGGQGRRGYEGREDDRHKVTFDCSWLNSVGVGVEGSVGLYEVDAQWGWVVPYYVDHEPDSPLQDLQCSGGQPLYGYERRSVAPLQAICLYGGDHVTGWLAANGWKRTDYDIAESSEIGREYQDYWAKQLPLRSGDYAAVLHGWHMQWPEDHFYMPAEMSLLMWTFWEAEPWVELWWRSPNFRVESRVS
jgi:hypothetical protein